MVMDLLGKSIEDLFNEKKKLFSHKTILMIGMQMVIIFIYCLKNSNLNNICISSWILAGDYKTHHLKSF